jgi:Fe-S-cluster containining protein
MHAFGINPSDGEVGAAIGAARASYGPLPETTCDHRAICCRAGCPNMYYAEFLSIHDGHVLGLTEEQRLDLTIECVKRYLQTQKVENPKPCVFLGEGNMCKTYQYRPLKCRLYGLIPADLYERNVDDLSAEMGVPKEGIPLCQQCDRVRVKPEFKDRFPDGKVPSDEIKALEAALRSNDRRLGVPKKVQDAGFGYLTYHDWHVMFELGEEWMARLTALRTTLGDAEKEHFVSALKDALARKR